MFSCMDLNVPSSSVYTYIQSHRLNIYIHTIGAPHTRIAMMRTCNELPTEIESREVDWEMKTQMQTKKWQWKYMRIKKNYSVVAASITLFNTLTRLRDRYMMQIDGSMKKAYRLCSSCCCCSSFFFFFFFANSASCVCCSLYRVQPKWLDELVDRFLKLRITIESCVVISTAN